MREYLRKREGVRAEWKAIVLTLGWLAAAPLFAQNAVTVVNSAPDESIGSFGWAVTTLNASGLAGAITFAGTTQPQLSQTLPPISQAVTFQGGTLTVIGGNEAESQLLFQQAFTQSNNFGLINNGSLASGLDASITASSWAMDPTTSAQLNGASGVALSTTGGAGVVGQAGGNTSVTVGAWVTGQSVALDAGAGGAVTDNGGAGDVGGHGGSASVSATSVILPVLAGSNFQLSAGAGGDATDLGTGTNTGGTGGSASVQSGLVSIGDFASFTLDGGIGGHGVTGGAGGGATLAAASVSVVSSLTIQAGNGGNGLSLGGSGGSAAISFGNMTDAAQNRYLYVTGGNGGSSSGTAGNGGNAMVSGNSVSLIGNSGFQVAGGSGGSYGYGPGGVVNGGNGGNASLALAGFFSDSSNAYVTVTGGNGGAGSSGATAGTGGKGGDTSLTLTNFNISGSNNIVLGGGLGGAGGASTIAGFGATGGAGGNLSVTVGALTMSTGSSLTLTGNAGGAGGSSAGGSGGTGGNGGNVSFVAGAVTLSTGDKLDMAGGAGGIGGAGGTGGTAGTNGSQGQVAASVGDLEGAGSFNINGINTVLMVGQGDYAGSLTGTDNLQKVGSGALTLAGSNTYSGGTVVIGGSLLVDTGGTLGSSAVQVESGAILNYLHSSSASNTTINNDLGGTSYFSNNSTAGNAVITNNATLSFLNSSSAGSAVITTNNLGTVYFDQTSNGGTAQLITHSGGTVDISNEIQSSTAVGSIAGAGTYDLGANNLATGTNNLSTTVSGLIADGGIAGGTGGSLTKVGTGTLTLSSNNSYSGGTNIAGGALAVANGASVSQLGSGNVNVSGGTLETSGGPLIIHVYGNYTQGSNGTLQLGLGGIGAYSVDRFNAVGTANLDGTLSLPQSYGVLSSLPIGTEITIMTASAVNGVFGQVDENFSGIRLLPLYLSNAVVLESIIPSFQAIGLTANQKAIGADLDSVALKPQMNSLISNIGVFSNSSLQAAYTELSPEDFTSLYQAGFEEAMARSAMVEDRLSQLRAEIDRTVWLPGFSNSSTPWFAANLTPVQEETIAPRKDDGWSGFISGNGGFFNVASDGNAAGFKATAYGLTAAGADLRLSRESVVGLMAGYGHTDVTLGTTGTLAADGGQLGLYGLFYSEGFYADGLVEGGINSYSTQRIGIGGVVTGSTQGSEYDGAVEMGYSIKQQQVGVGPFGALQYTHVGMNGFTEQGSLAPLKIPAQGENSLVSQLGIQGGAAWKAGSATIDPTVKLAWEHEYNYKGGIMEAGFGTGDNFTVAGPQIGQNGILVGGGVEVAFSKDFSVNANYQGELNRTNLSSNQIGGGAKIGF